MDINQRIAQWENMAQSDPENAMGWFSLGSAYRDAERREDAARALRKSIELDPELSRAYQLLGQVLLQLGQEDEAADVLERGYTVAAERGDVMPQRAMASLLQEKLGRELPEVERREEVETQALSEDTIVDRRTGRVGTRMPEPPMRGPVGAFIQAHYSMETWREWIGMGTKVINELRLDFSNVRHQQVYDQHMMEWLGFTEEDVAAWEDQGETDTETE